MKFAGIVDLFLPESRPKDKKKPPLFSCRNDPLEELQRCLYGCIEIECYNNEKSINRTLEKIKCKVLN